MTPFRISQLTAWEALDSRGAPTVAVQVRLAGRGAGMAIVPAGASTGRFEALELRDGGQRFAGRGVRRAVANVIDVVAPGIVEVPFTGLATFDRYLLDLDGDRRCRRLGANAILPVSIATALAVADREGIPLWSLLGDGEGTLPLPMVNIVSGGAHAGRRLDIQDVLAVPVRAPDLPTAIEWTWRVRRGTEHVLNQRGYAVDLVADEGGLAAPLADNRAALAAVVEGIEHAGLTPGDDVAIAIDVAANSFQHGGGYRLATEDRSLETQAWVELLGTWCDELPIISVEDPVADDDEEGWKLAADRLLPRLQLLGDDRFATDVERVADGITQGTANAVLVKPNQSGTLSGARDVVDRCKAANWATVVSARSGDTEQSWLADLAVGWRAGQIKVGSTTRSERTAKWNRLLELAATTDLPYVGGRALAGDGS